MILWLATKFPTLWRFRRWIGYGLAALAVVWALWAVVDSYGDRRAKSAADDVRAELAAATDRAKTERIEWYETQISLAKAAQAKAEADSAALAGKLTGEQVRANTLLEALSRARLVSSAPSSIPGCPPVGRLSAAFRVCVNAATASGSAAASQTADCKAFGVPVGAAP